MDLKNIMRLYTHGFLDNMKMNLNQIVICVVLQHQEELEQLIRRTSLEDAALNCDRILAFYGTKETGRAAETIAERIVEFAEKVRR